MADSSPKKSGGLGKPDFATIGGLLLAAGGILGGLLLEGGQRSGRRAGHRRHDRARRHHRSRHGHHADVGSDERRQEIHAGAVRQSPPSRRVDRRDHRLCHQGAQKQHRVARRRSGADRRPLPQKGPVAGGRRHGAAAVARGDGAADHPGREARRGRREGVRSRRRLRPDRRHHRRRAGADPGDEEPREHRRSRPRHRGGVRGDGVWRRRRQPAVPAGRGQNQSRACTTASKPAS